LLNTRIGISAKEQTGKVNAVVKLLIVDDELDITRILKKGLELLGAYSVDTFNDPLEALSNFDAGTYDMVILDIRMPKMNGFELCRKITQKDAKTKV
jgi:CheY-like chemotaxis protein